ncbi:MAG: hypothetical protein HYY46_19860 [Deltaproteobacteria bacterium]|nr:hypothetical protein [Deltaproteobacteria bacterium]
MNARLAELARHRESLISRSAAQRKELLQNYRELERPVKFVKGLIRVIQTLSAHPAVVIGVTALLLGARRRKLINPLGLGWRLLNLFQALRSKPPV